MFCNSLTRTTGDIDLDGNYGLFHEDICFRLNIKNDEVINVHDIIKNKEKNIELLCVGKDRWRLITNDSHNFITGFDLCLTYEKV